MAKTERSFTSADLVNKPVGTIGPWATRPGKRKSRLASVGTLKAKAMLARLAQVGIR